jgi:hypothetical protein
MIKHIKIPDEEPIVFIDTETSILQYWLLVVAYWYFDMWHTSASRKYIEDACSTS